VRPQDFAGRYAFYDDGWPGTLELTAQDDGRLEGTFSSHRFDSEHAVHGHVDPAQPHRAEFDIESYNWLPAQRFTGMLFTQGRNGMTGTTEWEEECFGFLATKSGQLGLSAYRPGRVKPSDLVGEFRIVLDGVVGTLALQDGGVGTFRSQAGEVLEVRATVGDPVEHAVRVTIPSSPGSAPAFTVLAYLFTRPKSAAAGWMEWDGLRLGCYLLRYR
jgi:hypothetical protein